MSFKGSFEQQPLSLAASLEFATQIFIKNRIGPWLVWLNGLSAVCVPQFISQLNIISLCSCILSLKIGCYMCVYCHLLFIVLIFVF